VKARKEKRHRLSKMETALDKLVKKCTGPHESGLSYYIPNADKCARTSKGDKNFNLFVSKARFVIANMLAQGPRQDESTMMAMRDAIEDPYYDERGEECTFATFEDVYNSFQGTLDNEPMWNYPFRMMRFGRGAVYHCICARVWLVVTLGSF
jgi:hypothetical protein